MLQIVRKGDAMKALMMAVGLAALPLAALAQDAAKVDANHYKVLVDNASVRVLKVLVGPGEKSPTHSHPDAMLIPLSSGKARFTLPDGKTEDRDMAVDSASFTPATTHAPANVGTSKIEAILVEFKAPTAGTAALPGARPGIQQTVLAESPRASAIKGTAGADFHEAAGTSHEFDQVVIALNPGDMTLAVDGKAPVTKWQRGDVQFIGRGVKHESKNTSGKPIDFVIVAIK
jgi:quercetin dioxygenase-like cupin family protein